MIKELRDKLSVSLRAQLLLMNMISLVAGFVGVPLFCWLMFEVLPGGDERAAMLASLELSNIGLAAMTLGLNILLFSGTFLWLFRGKRRYLKEIIEQTRRIGSGEDIAVVLGERRDYRALPDYQCHVGQA